MGKKLSNEERQRREAIAEAKREATAKRIEENRLKREAIEAEIRDRRDAGTRKSTTLDEMCFPVELRDNPRNTNTEHSKVVVGIIDGEEIDLNYCSPIYELVPNEMIFPKVEEILNQHGIKFKAEYSHTKNARFYGNYTIEDERFHHQMKGTNDVIKFIWNFEHSYNGLTKYKGVAGFYRLVCTNGLVVPVQEMEAYNLEIKGKHTASILKSLDDFSAILTRTTNELTTVKKSIVQKYEVLGDRWIADPVERRARVEEVLNATKIGIKDNKSFDTIDNIMGRITDEATKTSLGYDGKVNDWLIYNGINQYVNDNTLNIAAPEKRRETDSKVLEYMLEYA